jgi:hypothetical protein
MKRILIGLAAQGRPHIPGFVAPNFHGKFLELRFQPMPGLCRR